ncbi:MAG: hypothetical protein ABSG30_04650 [Steroidobacteraceae bacterium]
MIVSFTVTFAYLYWKQKTSEVPARATPLVAIPQAVHAPSRISPLAPSTPADPPVRAAAVAAPRPLAAPSAEPADEQSSLLPVTLRMRHIRRDNRVEGLIKSLSENPLSVTLVSKNHEGDETARVSIQLTPFESKPFSTDDGLDLESGGQVLLQSQGYQDRQAPIP